MKKIIIHLGIMAALVIAVIIGIFWFLDSYTNHDTVLVKVQNLEGVSSAKAISLLENAGLEAVISDTVYKDGAKKLTVINQNPSAGLEVKPGRKVYLVINTDDIPMVEVPKLANNTSLPEATNILLRRHLKVGKVSKVIVAGVESRGNEPVLAQYIAGTNEEITPGTKVARNSYIDLLVGISADYYDTDSTILEESVPTP